MFSLLFFWGEGDGLLLGSNPCHSRSLAFNVRFHIVGVTKRKFQSTNGSLIFLY